MGSMLISGKVGDDYDRRVPINLTPNGNLLNDRVVGAIVATQQTAPAGNDHRIAWRLNKDVAWIRTNTADSTDPAESPLSGRVVVTGIALSEAGSGRVPADWSEFIPVESQEASVRVRFPGESPIYFQIRANMGIIPLYGVEIVETAYKNNSANGIILLGYKQEG